MRTRALAIALAAGFARLRLPQRRHLSRRSLDNPFGTIALTTHLHRRRADPGCADTIHRRDIQPGKNKPLRG